MKKLYRSKSNQMLCGVCAGIGEYTNVDANVIRLIFGWCLPVMQKLLSFSFGVLLVIYVLFACSVVAFVQAYEVSIVLNHTFCLKLSHFLHTFYAMIIPCLLYTSRCV